MDTKTIVKYVTYVVGAIAIVKVVATSPVTAGVLVVCALVNIFYVNAK